MFGVVVVVVVVVCGVVVVVVVVACCTSAHSVFTFVSVPTVGGEYDCIVV